MMNSKTEELIIRPAHNQDRQSLANLIHFETRVHRHLDWRPPLDWFGYSPYLVAERNGGVVASLACPPDPPEIAWIRMFAVSSTCSVSEAWQSLWTAARALLSQQQEYQVAAIPLQQWFQTLLERNGFSLINQVVMLEWRRGTALPPPRTAMVNIRSMTRDDLRTIEQVDSTAFGPVWRNSFDSITLSYNQAALATIAEQDERIVGYQISTASPMGAHLARLAVLPELQGQGIGFSLVRDLLDQFERRGALRITVNTQEDNPASLRLYDKMGFSRTGEKYPVYHIMLNP